MRTDPPQVAAGAGFGSSTATIRQTAKWIVTGFMAFGALLVGSLPLTEIGQLELRSPRAVAACIGGLAASVAIAVVAVRGASILTSRYTTLRAVLLTVDTESRSETLPEGVLPGLARDIVLSGDILYRHVATDVRDLFARLRRGIDSDQRDVAKLAELRTAALDVVELADHLDARSRYKSFVTLSLWMGLLAIAGAVVVAVSLTATPEVSPFLDSPQPARVALTKSGRTVVQDRFDCDASTFDAVIVGGSLSRPVVVADPPGCDAMRFELEPGDAVVIPTVE